MEFDVGARLRAIREMHGLSQRELAKRAGVSNASVSLIEQNKSSPSVGSLKKVLDGIPMSLADFFSIEQAPREQVFFRAEDLTVISDGLSGTPRLAETRHRGYFRSCTSGTSPEPTPGRTCCATLRRKAESCYEAGWR